MKKLEPIKELTPELYDKLIVVQDFHQAVGLSFIGRYFRVPMTETCPTLYYLYVPELDDYKVYAVEKELIEFNSYKLMSSESESSTEAPTEEVTEDPTDAPTEEVTEEPTEAPTEEVTEEPTDAPTEEVTEEPTEEYTSNDDFTGSDNE